MQIQPGADVKGSDGAVLGKLEGVQTVAGAQQLKVRGSDGVLRGVSLAGLKQDLAASIKGQGDWDFWQGRLLARLGNRELSALDINQREGEVRIRGFVRPEPLIGSSFARKRGSSAPFAMYSKICCHGLSSQMLRSFPFSRSWN